MAVDIDIDIVMSVDIGQLASGLGGLMGVFLGW